MCAFTASLIITKKVPIFSAEFLRKSLLDRIVNMYTNETLSDFTFVVREKRFKVHKSILAASSVVMHKMFTAEYQEKNTGECVIVDIDPHIFEAFICFIYSYTVPDNLKDIAHELFEAAHYYEVESLKKVCLNEIQNELATQNAMKSYALAFKYDLKKLTADAWKIIRR